MLQSIVLIVLTLLATLQSISALPRNFEGFTYLGPVPSSSNTELSTKASFYYISTAGAAWHIEFSRCSLMEGKLATPLNPLQDEALRNYVANANHGSYIWTAGYKNSTSGPWRWETNNVNMTYENFQTASCKTNSGLCLCASHPSGGRWGWCGAGCTTAYYYVCEF